MRTLIIEDEQATALRLKKLLLEIEPDIEILDILDSIESCVNWYKSHTAPDLIFQDIELADGSSFEIFKQVKVDAPIIFITAYNQFALDAFKVNSVDYLLKPVKKSELTNSIEKFKKLYTDSKTELDYLALANLIIKEEFQKRFIVRYGNTIKAIDIENIAYFFSDSGNLFFRTFDNNTYPLDYSLDKLEPMINPEIFYRINRQFIIQYKAIKEMYGYSKSRVRIVLEPACELETIASTDRSSDFKKWLTGK